MPPHLLLSLCPGMLALPLVLSACVDRAVAEPSATVQFLHAPAPGRDSGEGARIVIQGTTVILEEGLPAPERCPTLSAEVFKGPPGELLVRLEAIDGPWPCPVVHPAPRYRLELHDLPASVSRLRVVVVQWGADGQLEDRRTRLVSLPNAPFPPFR